MASKAIIPLRALANKRSFQKLRMRHRRVMALHLQGHTNNAIAQATKFSRGYINYILNVPDNKSMLQGAYTDQLERLVPQAVSALERNMRCGDPSAEVRAADIALKASGRYATSEEGRITAEDVIERVLERISPDGTTTRAVERRIFSRPLGGSNAPSSS